MEQLAAVGSFGRSPNRHAGGGRLVNTSIFATGAVRLPTSA
jgi:hypothetical protein